MIRFQIMYGFLHGVAVCFNNFSYVGGPAGIHGEVE